MSEPLSPRWWRLDPQSQVELQWGEPESDLEDFSLTGPSRPWASRRCISLRSYKDEWVEGQRTCMYGAWRTFDLLPCPDTQHGAIHGRTTIVEGVAMVDVFASDAPTIGEWHPADPPRETAVTKQPWVIPRHWLDRAQVGGRSLETIGVLAGWQAARQHGLWHTDISDAIVIAALDAVLAHLRQAASQGGEPIQ